MVEITMPAMMIIMSIITCFIREEIRALVISLKSRLSFITIRSFNALQKCKNVQAYIIHTLQKSYIRTQSDVVGVTHMRYLPCFSKLSTNDMKSRIKSLGTVTERWYCLTFQPLGVLISKPEPRHTPIQV